MSISFKDIQLLNNGKLEYFEEIFKEELKKKNFLGSLFSDIYSSGETAMNFWFAFIFLFMFASLFFLFKVLFLLIPTFSFFAYYTYKYHKALNQINLSKRTNKINFLQYLYQEEDIQSINNKISELSQTDIDLLNKIAIHSGSLKKGFKRNLYNIMWNKIYWANLDEIKDNKDIIFKYLKSNNFNNMDDYNKNKLIEKVEEKMNKATHSEKVALLEEKYNKKINNENKLIKEL
tara:strand:- start:954 stop:1652 length:699 start_codon:yes stop_codon:yes gene_type:complete